MRCLERCLETPAWRGRGRRNRPDGHWAMVRVLGSAVPCPRKPQKWLLVRYFSFRYISAAAENCLPETLPPRIEVESRRRNMLKALKGPVAQPDRAAVS